MQHQADAVREMLRQRLRRGDRFAFEPLYSSANFDASVVPWAELRANAHVTSWLDRQQVSGTGRRAIVVGCGLGDDAEELSRRGFDVTAFDISPTAVEWCRQRFPQSVVRYQTADLLAPPAHWRRGFDFVLEVYTLQSLPAQYRAEGIAQLAHFVAPAGTLLVLCRAREEDDPLGDPPFPLSRTELDAFTSLDLQQVAFDELVDDGDPPVRRFRACYVR